MFVHSPNLPQADAAFAAVSATYPEIIAALHRRGIKTAAIPRFLQLSEPVCAHTDMVLHHFGGNQVLLAVESHILQAELEQEGFQVSISNVCISSEYPHDVALNAARIRARVFAKPEALAPEIKQFCDAHEIQIIPVKQGYAKCSIVIVNENSIITEDQSIAQAAQAVGMDVLQVSSGAVRLEGYSHGFLGGACGMIGKKQLAFTGSLQVHPDAKRIQNFCRAKHVEIVTLTEGPLFDIGGILVLKTKGNGEKSRA